MLREFRTTVKSSCQFWKKIKILEMENQKWYSIDFDQNMENII